MAHARRARRAAAPLIVATGVFFIIVAFFRAVAALISNTDIIFHVEIRVTVILTFCFIIGFFNRAIWNIGATHRSIVGIP